MKLRLNLLFVLCFLSMVPVMASPVLPVKGTDSPSRPQVSISKEIPEIPEMTAVKYEPQVTEHRVRKGENLYVISKMYFVALSTLIKVNQIPRPDLILPGQKLNIPPVDFRSGEIRQYQVPMEESLYALLNRYRIQLWQFQRLNPGVDTKKSIGGKNVFLPLSPLPAPKKTESVDQLQLIRPVRGVVSSRYGWRSGRMHYGLDMAAPTGTPVVAASSGYVSYAGWRGAYGMLVEVKHDRFVTRYGHLSRILVQPGQKVAQGTMLGLVGATGRATGSHLHFEVEVSGKRVDPGKYL